jgi:hypothetical protein
MLLSRNRLPNSGCRPNKTTHQALSLRGFSAQVRRYIFKGWSFIGDSTRTETLASKSPTYYYAIKTYPQYQVIVKLPGSFRLAAGNRHLHRYCIFTGLFLETVPRSLHHSCASIISRHNLLLSSINYACLTSVYRWRTKLSLCLCMSPCSSDYIITQPYTRVGVRRLVVEDLLKSLHSFTLSLVLQWIML